MQRKYGKMGNTQYIGGMRKIKNLKVKGKSCGLASRGLFYPL